MLIAEKVSRIVHGRRIVDGVSVRFEAGKLNVIMGPNGAGKSSLLKLLNGQDRVDAGSVRYGDVDVRAMTLPALARIRATLSQNVEIAFPLRAWEVVMMGRYPHLVGKPGPQDQEICEEVMRLFDVAPMAERDYLTLSGGEQQRVHFARVLAQLWAPPGQAAPPRYLFLDEPLTFLDIYYQFEFMRKVRQLLREHDLVVVGVLHDLNLAARFADQVVLMHEGRVLAAGTRDEVLTPENIHTAFRVTPKVVRGEDGARHLVFD